MKRVSMVRVDETWHIFEDTKEAWAFYTNWRTYRDAEFLAEQTVWAQGEHPELYAKGDPYCPYCTDGREPREGETLCGQPGCRDFPHASDDERDHAETLPGKAAHEDIGYKFD